DLSRSRDRFLFGYNRGSGHIFSASGALFFTANQRFAGLGAARGITCRTWYSCLYWPDMDATMNVTWYFSDPRNWDTSLALHNVPVRVHVVGRVGGDNAHNFEHIYDLMHYTPFIESVSDFETPSGVTCPGRKNTKAFPNLADAFSFSVEIVDNIRQQVSFMKEWYDRSMGLVQFMYKPSPSSQSPYGSRPLKEIHDFNTGVAYIMDPMVGNCTVRRIEPGSFDDKSVDPHHVRIRTSKEFFYTDASIVTYEGV
ncbi:uncharacterized protein LOC121366718, partial [Gigantopelta aegis]|uniref:uncharacterized protein LOC121366718 n=1 Tax=Gigantopelta aegis TaxID=1735272 RepID=UPI001B88B308